MFIQPCFEAKVSIDLFILKCKIKRTFNVCDDTIDMFQENYQLHKINNKPFTRGYIFL